MAVWRHDCTAGGDPLAGVGAGAPDSTVVQLEGGPSAYLLHRHRHRDEHIDHIRRALAVAS